MASSHLTPFVLVDPAKPEVSLWYHVPAMAELRAMTQARQEPHITDHTITLLLFALTASTKQMPAGAGHETLHHFLPCVEA